MTRKRIIIIHHTSSQGGGTRSMYDLVDMLHNNHDLIICTPKNNETIIEDLSTYNNVSVYTIKSSIPVFPRYSGGASLFSSSFVKSIIGLTKKNRTRFADEIMSLKPDLVIFNSIVTILSSPFINSKKICFVRETITDRIAKTIFKYYLNEYFEASCFLANYEKRRFNLHKTNSFIIPDCFKPNAFSKAENKNDITKILFLGGDSLIKGLDIVLKSLILIKDPSIKLVIAGSIDENAYTLESLVKRLYSFKYQRFHLAVKVLLPIAKNKCDISFTGYIGDTDKLYVDSDIVVFPSTYSHQSRPCIEAGYYSVPVIISDYPETREYFINEYNCLTFKPRNSFDLASAINRLMNDKTLANKLGQHNYHMSNTFHNYSETQLRLNDIIDNCLGN